MDSWFEDERAGCLIVAEIAQAHDGSLGAAHAYIDAVAGAGVEEHVHIHVVPRWLGDTNFMPVVGDMRVVPQTWLQTYDDLKAALEE